MACVRQVASRVASFSRRPFWRVEAGAATLVPGALKRPSIAGRLGALLAARAGPLERLAEARRPLDFISTVIAGGFYRVHAPVPPWDGQHSSPAAPDAVSS